MVPASVSCEAASCESGVGEIAVGQIGVDVALTGGPNGGAWVHSRHWIGSGGGRGCHLDGVALHNNAGSPAGHGYTGLCLGDGGKGQGHCKCEGNGTVHR